jgi:hypothetical protein
LHVRRWCCKPTVCSGRNGRRRRGRHRPATALPPAPTALAGALLCFGLRFMAIRHGWRLPVARARDS